MSLAIPSIRFLKMLPQLKKYILDHEDWLMEKILNYAKQQGYTEYTSTLREAWRLSISGLSKSLIATLNAKGLDLELGPHEKYISDPASQFGIIEAQEHRKRGVNIDMFLGLMKYYRQSYSDLIRASNFEDQIKFQYEQIIKRFFDRVEIGFCLQWTPVKDESIVKDLQLSNRVMTNEKNRYLTIFESLSMPVFIVTFDGIVENMNHAASKMLNYDTVPGTQYYGEKDTHPLLFIQIFPWLDSFFKRFKAGSDKIKTFETMINNESQFFFISFSRSLDISGKFSDTVIVIIEDITERKTMEKELEKLATTDPLTGAKNRRSFLNLFRKEMKRSLRYNYSLALFMIDIDHFKKINDNFGHDTGDKVLRQLVAKSFSVLRESDLFGRWGGEEFILLLPEIDIHQAYSAAERLRDVLAKSELMSNDGVNIRFTVSIGFTILRNKNISIDGAIKKADKALYMAKKQGRNRAVFLESKSEQ